jgi:hypothetical protein
MVVPIWFVMDDDGTLLFTTWHETIKAKALRRDGRVSLCVDDDRPPFSYVRVDGTTAITEDRELLRTWATRIAARYMGAEAAEQFGARNGVPGELLVRVTPTRIVAEAGIADA